MLRLAEVGLSVVEKQRLHQSLAQARRSLLHAVQVGALDEEVASLNRLGDLYEEAGEYRRAVESFERLLHIALSNNAAKPHWEGKALTGLGVAYTRLGKFEKAVIFHKKAIQIAIAQGFMAAEAASWGNLGNTLREMGEFEESATCFERSATLMAQAMGGTAHPSDDESAHTFRSDEHAELRLDDYEFDPKRCDFCKGTDEPRALIVCSGIACSNVLFHYYCRGYPSFPVEPLYCFDCTCPVCRINQYPDNLLVPCRAEGCRRGLYHRECTTAGAPPFCHLCVCRACGRRDDEDELIVCKGERCGRPVFHTDCVPPWFDSDRDCYCGVCDYPQMEKAGVKGFVRVTLQWILYLIFASTIPVMYPVLRIHTFLTGKGDKLKHGSVGKPPRLSKQMSSAAFSTFSDDSEYPMTAPAAQKQKQKQKNEKHEVNSRMSPDGLNMIQAWTRSRVESRDERKSINDSLEQQLGASSIEEAVKMLLEDGHDPNVALPGNNGARILHQLSAVGYGECVRMLVSAGADLDTVNCTGESPLHLAAKHGHLDIVDLLLTFGADATLRTKDGKTALMYARETRHWDIVGLLKELELQNNNEKKKRNDRRRTSLFVRSQVEPQGHQRDTLLPSSMRDWLSLLPGLASVFILVGLPLLATLGQTMEQVSFTAIHIILYIVLLIIGVSHLVDSSCRVVRKPSGFQWLVADIERTRIAVPRTGGATMKMIKSLQQPLHHRQLKTYAHWGWILVDKITLFFDTLTLISLCFVSDGVSLMASVKTGLLTLNLTDSAVLYNVPIVAGVAVALWYVIFGTTVASQIIMSNRFMRRLFPIRVRLLPLLRDDVIAAVGRVLSGTMIIPVVYGITRMSLDVSLDTRPHSFETTWLLLLLLSIFTTTAGYGSFHFLSPPKGHHTEDLRYMDAYVSSDRFFRWSAAVLSAIFEGSVWLKLVVAVVLVTGETVCHTALQRPGRKFVDASNFWRTYGFVTCGLAIFSSVLQEIVDDQAHLVNLPFAIFCVTSITLGLWGFFSRGPGFSRNLRRDNQRTAGSRRFEHKHFRIKDSEALNRHLRRTKALATPSPQIRPDPNSPEGQPLLGPAAKAPLTRDYSIRNPLLADSPEMHRASITGTSPAEVRRSSIKELPQLTL